MSRMRKAKTIHIPSIVGPHAAVEPDCDLSNICVGAREATTQMLGVTFLNVKIQRINHQSRSIND